MRRTGRERWVRREGGVRRMRIKSTRGKSAAGGIVIKGR